MANQSHGLRAVIGDQGDPEAGEITLDVGRHRAGQTQNDAQSQIDRFQQCLTFTGGQPAPGTLVEHRQIVVAQPLGIQPARPGTDDRAPSEADSGIHAQAGIDRPAAQVFQLRIAGTGQEQQPQRWAVQQSNRNRQTLDQTRLAAGRVGFEQVESIQATRGRGGRNPQPEPTAAGLGAIAAVAVGVGVMAGTQFDLAAGDHSIAEIAQFDAGSVEASDTPAQQPGPTGTDRVRIVEFDYPRWTRRWRPFERQALGGIEVARAEAMAMDADRHGGRLHPQGGGQIDHPHDLRIALGQ